MSAEAAPEPRFAFGRNWRRFLARIDEPQIRAAEESLQERLGLDRLEDLSFLDAGCGSGLFSLAARRLGARVYSFDCDAASVACAETLRARYFAGDTDWTVARGDVLDTAWLGTLDRFDIVYSWGVLHHTGALWRAVESAASSVAPGGRYFIALYNDQGWISRYWHAVKRVYQGGAVARAAMVALHAPYLVGARAAVRALRGDVSLARGMDMVIDLHDWLGGLPFEVARPDAVVRRVSELGFVTARVVTCGRRHGCNEFVFRHPAGGES